MKAMHGIDVAIVAIVGLRIVLRGGAWR